MQLNMVAIAQLVRALVCDTRGRWVQIPLATPKMSMSVLPGDSNDTSGSTI